MISGATGATAVAMVGLVIVYGSEYLFATIILTGLIQIAVGLLKFGKFIKLVPYPVMLGFVNGLAIVKYPLVKVLQNLKVLLKQMKD